MLKLVCTCSACPEQYDIYDGNKLVAYVRLRWGELTVSPYDDDEHISDEIIYERSYSDKFKGEFEEEERQETLDYILMLVYDYLKFKEKSS